MLPANKLPGELGYIAFVESGFSPQAVSRANAYGVWQFIPETGRRYGLHSEEDFHDVRKSTMAASGYLLDLISIFGSRSFLLATAAYNAGRGEDHEVPAPDRRSVPEAQLLGDPGCLALETQEYVPKILAAAVIELRPQALRVLSPHRAGDAATLRRGRGAAGHVHCPPLRLAGIDPVDLRLANNDLDPNTSYTPGRNFPLYLPVGSGTRLSTALAAVPPDQPQVMLASSEVPEIPAERPERRPTERSYKVKAGDTLSSIARTYDVEVDALAKTNDILSPYTLSVGQRLVLPGDGSTVRIVYTVKSSNSLSDVAEAFSVREEDILDWNDLRSRKLKSGQKLTLFPPRDYETKTYKVRRGDSLAAIARRLGVSLDHLLTVNGLTSKKVLRPGQRLVAYVPA